MALLFEWDARKARRNLAIHGVSFDEASTAFRDPLSKTIEDPLHSESEDRFVLLGPVASKSPFGCCAYRKGRPNTTHQRETRIQQRKAQV